MTYDFTTVRTPESPPSEEEITTNERILSSANENTAILKTLSETEYATAALSQTTLYHNDLIQEHGLAISNLQKLRSSLAKEQKEHESYRNSTMKRLAYRAAGRKERFAFKAEKEERDYLEAVQAHFAAQQHILHLERQMTISAQHVEDLKKMKKKHDKAQKKLDRLYKSIFDGPTPEFPAEDKEENKVNAYQHEFALLQKKLSVENQTLSTLKDADKFLHCAASDLETAMSASMNDIWGIGRSYADYLEQSSLASAQSNTSQVSTLVERAKRLQPLVGDVGSLRVGQGSMMGDIIFDHVASDLQIHDEVANSLRQVQEAEIWMNEALNRTKERTEDIKRGLEDVARKLKEARKELEEVRRVTFEKVAGGLPGYPEPSPAYVE